MNKYDSVVLGSLDIAQNEALSKRNLELFPEHLLIGLIKNPSSYSSKSLKKYLNMVESFIAQKPTAKNAVNIEQIRPSTMLSQWLTQASSSAIQEGRKEVGEKDLLRLMPQIMPHLKIDYNDLKEADTEEVEIPSFLILMNSQKKESSTQ